MLAFSSGARLALLGFPLLLLACGSPDPGGAAPPPSPCAALDCAGRQQICVEDAAGARCEACPSGQYAAGDACAAIEGVPLPHEFAKFTVQPGEEVLGLCQSWTLGNAEAIWVNAVELYQDEASHHSNWTFVPADKFDGPDGVWACQTRGYDQVKAALAGGVLYAQSTQTKHEVQKFPAGVAVRIPPYARIIGDVHLLNTGTTPVTGSLWLTVYGIPEADVKVKLAPFHLTYEGLAIPPHAKSRFFGECQVDSGFRAAANHPLDQRVYYVLPHTHSMARRFFLQILGGPRDGQSIIDLGSFDGEAHGRVFDPPIDMTGADGYRFGCEYASNRDDTVHWGFGDQEMCEVLGFAASDVGFESQVTSAAEVGADGDVRLFSSTCGTLAFAWDFNKPGGPPPP
jgi:hypothetical protein